MKYVLYLAISLMTILSFSQQVIVLEAETGVPIGGVAIFNANESTSVITNLDGKASLNNFAETELLFFQNILYKNRTIIKSQLKSDNFKIYLEPEVEGLNEVLISASRFKQNKRDIPQKIVNINAETIAFNNPQTSADVLQSSGNVYIQKSQLGGGSPMIRGFSTNRLLITVDGVRMNNAIFRGGNLQNVISIDPFSIQNTEITLGAGSVVYGSDAIGGVMSFYTKTPKLSYQDTLLFDANANMRYASASDEKTGHVDFNFGSEKWGFLTNVSYTNFNDLRMGSHGPNDYLRPEYVKTINGQDVIVENNDPRVQNPTGFSQINLMQKVRYDPKNNLNFDFGLYYSATSDFPRYDRLIRYRGENLRSAEWNYGPQRWFMGNFQVTKLSSSSNLYDKIQATAAYQNFQESRMDRDFQSEIRSIRREHVDAYSLNLDLEKKMSTKSNLFYGVEYIYNGVRSSGTEENVSSNTTVATVSRYPDGSTWQSMAAYGSLKFKPNDQFIFQSGLRYNHILIDASFNENNSYLNLPFDKSKIDTGALTGTAGINWLPNKIIHWRLNASTAFRAPNIDDIGKVFDSEPGSVVVPNQYLDPEYAYGGELGLQLNFGEVLMIDLATYYTFLDNALVRRNFTLNGKSQIEYGGELSNVQAIQNGSKANIYGLETGIECRFSKTLKITSQYNIMCGTEEDNGLEVPVRHIAPHFGNTHFVWQKKKLKLDAFAEYNSELSFNQLAPSEIMKDYLYALDSRGNPYSPSWYTLNLRTQYQLTDAALITATLENITDQRYQSYSSGIAAPGRNLILSFHYSL